MSKSAYGTVSAPGVISLRKFSCWKRCDYCPPREGGRQPSPGESGGGRPVKGSWMQPHLTRGGRRGRAFQTQRKAGAKARRRRDCQKLGTPRRKSKGVWGEIRLE